MQPAYIARGQTIRCHSGALIFCVRSLHINPRLLGRQRVSRRRKSATAQNVEGCPPAERKPRSLLEILSAEDTELIFEEPAWGKAAWVVEEGSPVSAFVPAEQSQHFLPEPSPKQSIQKHSAALPCLETAPSGSTLPAQPLFCPRCGDTMRPVTPTQRRGRSMSRRRGQRGYVEQKGDWWHLRYRSDTSEGRPHKSQPICLAVGKGKEDTVGSGTAWCGVARRARHQHRAELGEGHITDRDVPRTVRHLAKLVADPKQQTYTANFGTVDSVGSQMLASASARGLTVVTG